jgi:hypothetical protein
MEKKFKKRLKKGKRGTEKKMENRTDKRKSLGM